MAMSYVFALDCFCSALAYASTSAYVFVFGTTLDEIETDSSYYIILYHIVAYRINS